MRNLKAFALGAVAVAVLAYTIAAALAVTAQAANRSLDIGLGPFVVVSVARETATAVTTFGSGLLLVALLGGLANLAAGQLIRTRSGRHRDHVE